MRHGVLMYLYRVTVRHPENGEKAVNIEAEYPGQAIARALRLFGKKSWILKIDLIRQ